MRNLLLSTVTLLVVPAVALAAPDFSSQSHTHTTPIELEPISSSSGLKLASVCFLGYGDCGDGGFDSIDGDDGYVVDTAKQCQNEGYSVTACSLPSYTSGQCPYNNKYFAKCVEDRPRACKETGFTQTQCSSGMVVDTTCSYDANYKKCKCNPCSGYTYTYAQATAQGYVADGSCLSCSEAKYKRKENPCLGYTTCECGGEIGSAVCYTGSTQKFKSCKTCDPCPGYYECGGTWQYCEGTTCSADSSKCSTYCESDYFPNKCSSASDCNGIYRNGYCSGSCSDSSGSDSSGDSSSYGNTSCAKTIGCSCSELSSGRLKICFNTEYTCTPHGGSTYTVYESCGSSAIVYDNSCAEAIADRPVCATGGSRDCYVNSNTSYSACGF